MAATSPEVLSEGAGEPRPAAPSDAGHVASLTGYRGLAALLVLLVHGSGQTAYPDIGLRGYGPIALFTLSGYLLISPWAKWSMGRGSRPDLRTFVRRRLARIFPAYLVVLFMVALIYPASQPNGGWSWLRAITLTNFLAADGLRPSMAHVWSMGTEFSWYVALPVVGALLALLGRRVFASRPERAMYTLVVLSAAITIGWLLWIETSITDLNGLLTFPMWLPAYLLVFVLGAMVKFIESSPRGALRDGGWLRTVMCRPWVVLALAAGAVIVLTSDLSGPAGYVPLTLSERQTRNVASVALAVTLLVGLIAATPSSLLKNVLGSRLMVAIGRWSYGIYLWHLPVTILLAENMGVPQGPVGFVAWILLLLAVSSGLGALTYAWVELPAIAWSKRKPSRNG